MDGIPEKIDPSDLLWPGIFSVARGPAAVTSLSAQPTSHRQDPRERAETTKDGTQCTYGECTKGFQKHRQLRIHEYEHTGVLPFPCEKCNKRFLLPSKLNRHLKVHEGYNCRLQDCGATFDKWSVLQAHMKERHPHNTSKICIGKGINNSYCKRSYTKMSNLKTHIQSYHESRRPFSCTQQDCSKTFAHEISLRRHVKAVHDAKTSLPPRKPRKVGKRKSNFASRLTGYKEKKTPAEKNTPSEEEDSINPALLLPEEEHTTSGTSAPCGDLCEMQADTCHGEDSSTDSATDRIAENRQILTEDAAEGSLVIGTLETVDNVEEGDRLTESPQKPTREEDIAGDSLVIGTLETIDYLEEKGCTDVGSSETTKDPATANTSSCGETTEVKRSEVKGSEGKGESSEEVQLRVMA
ncbi:PREDICTED: zinc finger protein 85-like [Branchiostoma belcheri]|uniref:Zinc finger protein 85-like n=1 Tax=Branchiostoma belcheri TaxID=7741 RepID=A0A6P4Y5M4_BRABE|nr:PREDICTED: zinc finger protein 85-like [Branchiostoma belcheri]